MLKKIAVWYLRKKKCSVLIGYRITGGHVKAKSNYNYTYDNEFTNVDYRLDNDKPFIIPHGKFRMQIKK